MKNLMDSLIRKKFLLLLVTVFVFGILMIAFSGTDKKSENSVSGKPDFEIAGYEEALEERLKDIIEKIDGVGTVSVMVTLEGSAFYSYATDTSEDLGKDGNEKKERTVVLSSESTSKKEAVVSGYTLPKVKGAAVVCSGKLSETLRKRVIDVVCASLGISSAKICVTN